MSENDAPPPVAGRAASATAGDDLGLRGAETTRTHPASCRAASPAASALPQRIRPLPAPAVQSRTGPPVSIEILQRVIDGLNRL
jgi:hypothetical protein